MYKNKIKLLKKIWSIFTWVILAVIVLTVIVFAGFRIFGYVPYTVLSDSMSPQFSAGDLIYIKSAEFKEIQTGDIITYKADGTDVIITHRVVEIDTENKSFITKGDANENNDKAVNYNNVLGTVEFSIPKLGYVSNFISNPPGIIVVIIIILSIILLMILPEIFMKGKCDKKSPQPKESNGAEHKSVTEDKESIPLPDTKTETENLNRKNQVNYLDKK